MPIIISHPRRHCRNTRYGLMALVCSDFPVQRPGTDSDSDHTLYHERTFVVQRVPDGDALVLNVRDYYRGRLLVRLLGIDAPEVHHPRERARWHGKESRDALRALALGQPVRLHLQVGHTRDAYRRLLAYVEIPGAVADLAEAMVARGHAWADPRFNHPRKDRYLAAQKAAARARREIHADPWLPDLPGWVQRNELSRRTATYRRFADTMAHLATTAVDSVVSDH